MTPEQEEEAHVEMTLVEEVELEAARPAASEELHPARVHSSLVEVVN